MAENFEDLVGSMRAPETKPEGTLRAGENLNSPAAGVETNPVPAVKNQNEVVAKKAFEDMTGKPYNK